MADEKPKQYGEPQRSLRISNGLWDAAKDKAWRERTSVNAKVTEMLTDWTGYVEPSNKESGQ